MGFDKMLSFFNKNLHNINEDLFGVPQVVSNHIYIDINFLLYNTISSIEKDINEIILIILSVPYTDINIINSKLYKMFNLPHLKILERCDLLDGDNIDIIIRNFKEFIDNNIDIIINTHLYNTIVNDIEMIYIVSFIKSINIFFDGIPSYAKMIEQRRRRTKSYLDSINKKKLLSDFYKQKIKLITEDGLTYDYFEWIDHMYSYDKTLGPYSNTLNNIADYIENKLQEQYKNISIFVNRSIIDGEADFKIFKHMETNMIDCNISIHSCDSDFIFMILWYQMINITRHRDMNVMLINYSGTNKTVYFAKKIINSLLDRYMFINNISDDISLNVVFDFMALLLLFGNDIMPPSYEIGCELSLKQIFETHYNLYKSNDFIVKINNINIINFTNLSKWLLLLKSSNSFSMIILGRFYKIPHNEMINMVENTKNVNELAEKYDIDNEIYNNDKGFYMDTNPYQSLYNYIVVLADNTTDDMFNRPFKKFFNKLKDSEREYNKMTKSNNVAMYIDLYISLCQMFFYDFNLYSPYNLQYYGDMIAPSINMIISYIETNNMNDIMGLCYNKIIKYSKDFYFNPISHHLFITPYILAYEQHNVDIKHFESLMTTMNKMIEGVWYMDGHKFILKNIDPIKFINISNLMIKLYKDQYCNYLLTL
jgi:hypothetical protein